MSNLLSNPDLFFHEKSKSEISLNYPAFIIFVNAVVAMGLAVLLTTNLNNFSSDANGVGNGVGYIGILIGSVGGFIASFAVWIILAGIFYLISSRFESEGSFRRTLEFVSYGFVPKIFSSLISFFALYGFLSSINSSHLQLTVENYNQTFANSSLSYVSQIAGILCILLSANIWIFALLHARNMSVKNATLTVCIPVGLYLIYQIYSLIGGLI